MSSPPNRHAILVDLFVAGASVILGGTILTIGDIKDTFTRKVTITAVFNEVSGLQRGGNIWYAGMKVGTVQGLTFLGESEVEVTMRVDREATQFIPGDALAKISSDGLIGSRIVVIYGGDPAAAQLEEGDVLAIGATVSTEDIMATLQQNNVNLLALTTDLKGISAGLAAGEGTLGKLLSDEALYENASQTVATLGVASENAQGLTASLATFGAKLNRPGSLPNALVTDTTTYERLTATVDRLHDASGQAATAIGTVARGASDPTTPVGVLLQDREAAAALKATLQNLEQGTVLLNEDLEAAQHNFLLRPFFKKRAKQQQASAK